MTEAIATCHRCGAPAKLVNGRYVLHDTAPWGTPGLACLGCYRKVVAALAIPDSAAQKPHSGCCKCPYDPANAAHFGRLRKMHDGKEYGLDGEICGSCRYRLFRERNRYQLRARELELRRKRAAAGLAKNQGRTQVERMTIERELGVAAKIAEGPAGGRSPEPPIPLDTSAETVRAIVRAWPKQPERIMALPAVNAQPLVLMGV